VSEKFYVTSSYNTETKLDTWCREGESNPHGIASDGF
jgi:hypothetical protein